MEDTKRNEFNKFAKLCLKEEGYDRETINYVIHNYRNFELDLLEMNKLAFASSCLAYARHITNF